MDGWAGRVWIPDRDALVVGDVWGSGYFGDDLLRASAVRASLTMVRKASRGLWLARLGGERLIEPDPDVRALATIDPTATLLPPGSRLAQSAVAASLERQFHLRGVTPTLMLDGALFAAASLRSDPAAPVVASAGLGVPAAGGAAESIGIATLGIGLRATPVRQGATTVRLDVGIPVAGSPGLRRRPFIAVSFSPWLLAERHRDGRGVP